MLSQPRTPVEIQGQAGNTFLFAGSSPLEAIYDENTPAVSRGKNKEEFVLTGPFRPDRFCTVVRKIQTDIDKDTIGIFFLRSKFHQLLIRFQVLTVN